MMKMLPSKEEMAIITKDVEYPPAYAVRTIQQYYSPKDARLGIIECEELFCVGYPPLALSNNSPWETKFYQ